MLPPDPSPELLAPAGGEAQLTAAVQAGADAVYFGVGRMNMRAKARNFTAEGLPDLMESLHNAGVKGYLTLNALVFERELPEVNALIDRALEANIDGIIAADLSVVRYATERGIPVHISTQLSVSNSSALAFLFQLGIRRVVLARECSLEDLRDIRTSLIRAVGPEAEHMEFEVFAHGALCIAESGRCFLSGFETGRSASRGDCSQICRQSYTLSATRGTRELEVEGRHILSSRDLCTLPFLDQLLDKGISCLKIEGRNRSPDYVYAVTSAYRHAIDTYQDHKGSEHFAAAFSQAVEQGMMEVRKVFNRGFSDGYYMGQPLDTWNSSPGSQSTLKRTYIGQITKPLPAEGRVRVRLESSSLTVGDEIFFEGPTTGYQPFVVEGILQDSRRVSRADKGAEVELQTNLSLQPADQMYRYLPR